MSVAQELINSCHDLLKLKKQIDQFLDEDCDDEKAELAAEQIKKLIKGLAIDVGIHQEFISEYSGIDAELLTRNYTIRVKATDILDRTLKLKPSCSKSAHDVAVFKNRIKSAIDVLGMKPKQLELL